MTHLYAETKSYLMHVIYRTIILRFYNCVEGLEVCLLPRKSVRRLLLVALLLTHNTLNTSELA